VELATDRDALIVVRRRLREELRQRVDARGLATAPRTERRVRVREQALALLRESGAILPQRELTRVVNEVSDEVVGFGPIEFLLKDPEVTEVMVNGAGGVYVEREGRIERAQDGLFEGEEAVLHLIERIVGPLGLRVDESSPWADARLPDGSRVHAIPLTCNNDCIRGSENLEEARRAAHFEPTRDSMKLGREWGGGRTERGSH
jgi:pilus assembly protein CpaF